MRLIERLKTIPVPPVLYHYTTQSGLMGILHDNCIWATAAHYLNDSSEYVAGLEHIAHALRAEAQKAISKLEAANLLAIAEDLSQFWTICVVSLSSEGDHLSQWRAYAGGSGGFALGMRSESLRESAHLQGFYLVPCYYTPSDKQEAVEQLINEFREKMVTSMEWGSRETGQCKAEVTRLAMMFKDSSFDEEREWRLISIPKMVKELDFRQGTSMLIPFSRFALDKRRDAYLDSVTVGPTPHRELASNVVRMLLRKLGFSNPDQIVRETRVPFRNW